MYAFWMCTHTRSPADETKEISSRSPPFSWVEVHARAWINNLSLLLSTDRFSGSFLSYFFSLSFNLILMDVSARPSISQVKKITSIRCHSLFGGRISGYKFRHSLALGVGNSNYRRVILTDNGIEEGSGKPEYYRSSDIPCIAGVLESSSVNSSGGKVVPRSDLRAGNTSREEEKE